MTQENRLIVADKSWAETLPEWLLNEVRSERMINGLISVNTSKEAEVGNAEIVVYLFTACMRAPLHSEDQKIYLKLSGELMKKRGIELPDFMDVGELNEWENRCLDELRYKIKKARGKVNHPIFDILKEIKKVKGGKSRNGTK